MGGVSIPAREVGGDFFNYFPLREDEVAILVGDVSGKGVGAALLMASLQATIRARLGAERDLARLVDALDREMGSDEPLAPYYTLFLALLEGRTGRLRYVNAGHNTQFVLRRDGRAERLVLDRAPAGPLPGRRLRGAHGRDAGRRTPSSSSPTAWSRPRTRPGEPFGMSRLEALLKVHRAGDLPALLAHVDAAVRSHRGPVEAADDATMVALRFSSGTLAGSRG